jgi:integrase
MRLAAGLALEMRCRAAGAPQVRVHDLRHLHASLLLADGLPVPAVAARLGHASPAVTMTVYAHALKGQDAQAAQAVEALLGRAAAG